MHSVLIIALCTFVCEVRDALQSNHQCPARALTDVRRPDVAYITVNAIMDLIFPSCRMSLTSALAVMANDLVPLLIGAKSVAKTQIAETIQKRD